MNPPRKHTPFEALHQSLKGVPLAKSGRMDEALAAFNESIEMDPSQASSWYNRGFVLIAQGQYNEALDAFEKSIRLNPRTVHAWNGKGYALNAMGRCREALEALERAVEADPTQPYPWNGIGNAFNGIGRGQEALDAYNRAIEIDPRFAHPWNGKAILLDMRPELEIQAGHSARQSFCRALYLRRAYPQRFPLTVPMLLPTAEAISVPLLTRTLLEEYSQAGGHKESAALSQRIKKDCEEPLALLSALAATPVLSNIEKALWSGMVNFYHGHPITAFICFDAADSEDETCLAAQYYLILSLRDYLEPADKETAFALGQAEEILKQPAVPARQLYYAGLLFHLTHNREQAVSCFKRNGTHLPSLYVRHLCLQQLGNEAAARLTLGSIQEEERHLAGQGLRGYLSPATPTLVDPASPDWLLDLQLYIHARELETAITNIREQEG